MPYYRDKLLSAWGNERVYEVGKPATPVDLDLLANARRAPGGIGLIIPNPRKGLRNQVNGSLSPESNGDSVTIPKYLSDKSRPTHNGQNRDNGIDDVLASFAKFALIGNATDTPHGYEELHIRYGGPRGVQDFDFGCVLRCWISLSLILF